MEAAQGELARGRREQPDFRASGGAGAGHTYQGYPAALLRGHTSMHTERGRTRSPGTLLQGSLYRGWLRPQVLPPVGEVVLADGWDGGRSKYTGGGASGPWPRSQLSHAMAV